MVSTLHEQSSADRSEFDNLAAVVVSGDVILRRGKGPVSSAIVWYLHDGSWCSHCALIVKKEDLVKTGCHFSEKRIGYGETTDDIENENLLVIHSVAACLSGVNGVQIQTLLGFLQYSVPGSDSVYHPRMDGATRMLTVAGAAAALEQAVPFDHSYRSGNPAAVYCSSFLFRIFKQAGWQGSCSWQIKHGILCFSSFMDPRWYQRIYPCTI